SQDEAQLPATVVLERIFQLVRQVLPHCAGLDQHGKLVDVMHMGAKACQAGTAYGTTKRTAFQQDGLQSIKGKLTRYGDAHNATADHHSVCSFWKFAAHYQTRCRNDSGACCQKRRSRTLWISADRPSTS